MLPAESDGGLSKLVIGKPMTKLFHETGVV